MRTLDAPHLFCTYHRNGSAAEYNHSSTELPHLTTTTIMLMSSHYCIYCGDKAFPVQANFESFHSSSETTGYRCTCDQAMKELCIRMAIEVIDCRTAKSLAVDHYDLATKDFEPDPKFLSMILNSRKNLNIRNISDSSNGNIRLGEASTRDIRDYDLENARKKDTFYSDKPFSNFVQSVDRYILEIILLRNAFFEQQKSSIQKHWGLTIPAAGADLNDNPKEDDE